MRLGKIKQNGITSLETILSLAVLIVIVLVGFMVLSRSSQSDSSQILQRQKYIDSSISNLNFRNYNGFANSLYKSGYITKPLYNTTESLVNTYTDGGGFTSNPAYSNIICVDQLPSSYKYGTVNLSSTSTNATLSVNVFVPDSTSPTPYITNWVKSSGAWQLNSVSCALNQ